MNESIIAMISRTESIISGLRALADCSQAQPFHFSGDQWSGLTHQFFPNKGREGDDNRAIARPLARLLGGEWRTDGDTWRCDNITFPGLKGERVILHYIEPKCPSSPLDLSERTPDRDEPDYDAPKPPTPMENYLQNDEHHVR